MCSSDLRNQERINILAIADTERNQDFLPDVPTLQEAGYDVDDSSVNLRGVMTRKGVPEERLALLSEKFVEMFNDESIQEKMQKGGATMRVLDRDELKEMWQQRQETLEALFEEIDAKELAKKQK